MKCKVILYSNLCIIQNTWCPYKYHINSFHNNTPDLIITSYKQPNKDSKQVEKSYKTDKKSITTLDTVMSQSEITDELSDLLESSDSDDENASFRNFSLLFLKSPDSNMLRSSILSRYDSRKNKQITMQQMPEKSKSFENFQLESFITNSKEPNLKESMYKREILEKSTAYKKLGRTSTESSNEIEATSIESSNEKLSTPLLSQSSDSNSFCFNGSISSWTICTPGSNNRSSNNTPNCNKKDVEIFNSNTTNFPQLHNTSDTLNLKTNSKVVLPHLKTPLKSTMQSMPISSPEKHSNSISHNILSAKQIEELHSSLKKNIENIRIEKKRKLIDQEAILADRYLKSIKSITEADRKEYPFARNDIEIACKKFEERKKSTTQKQKESESQLEFANRLKSVVLKKYQNAPKHVFTIPTQKIIYLHPNYAQLSDKEIFDLFNQYLVND